MLLLLRQVMPKKLTDIFIWIYEFFHSNLKFATFQHFEFAEYEIHYLVDCGAGYMGGIDKLIATSVEDVIKNYRQNDIEKVYCDGKLVYRASWADL